MTDITELAQLRGRTVDYPYYLVECDCGKIYPSSELSGGEPMGDSGDYSDCYCPHCGEGEEHFAECADPETAWKAQQDKIDALVEALEKAQQQTTESENRVRKQNRHICELFDDNTALRQRIAGLESRTVTVKLPDINEYLAEVHDKTLNRAFRLLAEGVRAGDVAAMRAAGIKVEAE
nr:MAG TPA: sugar transporter sugar transporter complex, TRANSPORT [Caudoviricetes sp.]